MTYITDLHCHPSFKPYHNLNEDPDINIWDYLPAKSNIDDIPGALQNAIRDTERGSQSNLNTLTRGRVRGVFFVIHPIERGWMDLRKQTSHPLRKWVRNLVIEPKHMAHLAAAVSGISYEKAEEIIKAIAKDEDINYYNEETYKEYEFLKASQDVKGTFETSLKLVSNYNEYINIIKHHKKTIAGIITLEGGHTLMYMPKLSTNKKIYADLTDEEKRQIKNKYYLNIKKLKGTNTTNGFEPKHTPFWITLVHMYNNFLAGHAKSYREGTFVMPNIDDLVDQDAAIYTGFTPLGYQVVERLLNKSKDERRILIDIKHMSLQARKDYYGLVEKKRNEGDKIPIVFSHGGVTGCSESVFRGYDFNNDDTNAYLSTWSINLFNEDIKKIYESDGLIGIALHEGRIPGGFGKQILKDLKTLIKNKNARMEEYKDMLRWEYVRMFLSNAFHIVNIIGKKKAWDMISIGSDYDGIMDPFDDFKTSLDFRRFMIDVKTFLEDKKTGKLIEYKNNNYFEMSRRKMKKLMFGYSPTQIINKIKYRNTENFLKKYFTEAYLEGKGHWRKT